MPAAPLPPIQIRADQVEVRRQRAGYTTHAALAAAMGVTESTVGRVLGGKTEPSTRFVFELARVLGAEPADLFVQATA